MRRKDSGRGPKPKAAARGTRRGAPVRRRIVAGAGVVVLLAVVALVLGAGGSDRDGYYVRAIFDNASFVIPGEDVKIGGVVVGAIDALDLTPDNRAVVVLRIDDPAFQSFRRDAHCAIRLQSLIGEQFVECSPTQPRGDGVAPAKALERIASGPGEGEHLLPVANTETPVNLDLVNNIMRLPERQRFRLIINEFGAAVAGNGQALRAALRRANPALQQADRLVAVLAEQDRLLGRLVDASDRVLAPMAARRRELGGFIQHAGETAAATAQRGDDLERDLQKLPGFLRELKPAVDRFGALADQMQPALQRLDDHAPAINASVERLGAFTDAATPAMQTLGDLADRGRRTFPAIGPMATDFAALAHVLRPLAGDLGALSGSFDEAGGIEQLLRFIYFYTGTVNGEDAIGHYIRSNFAVSNCSARLSTPALGCESNFDKTGETNDSALASAASAQAGGKQALLEYLLGQEGGR